ncbi:SDR family NAD(P)-dependent oxidoreductase [Prochlorococcus sp. AH-716-O10]|nr:SDR family NAD(P)-dependent oxidoreductase [Prochlorococcus sp. AH-716-O10]
MNFSELQVGDIAIFNQKFVFSDFESFESLSRDNNLLHHDLDYAQESGYSSPIVPIHLTSLPLSRIAGCIFPGKSSLYLKNTITAINPVYYGNNLTYSAKIASKSDSTRLLTIKVNCYNNCNSNIAFFAEMSVTSRHKDAEISIPNDVKYISASSKKSIVILGASSSIGSSIALKLANLNYDLVLVYREKGKIYSDLLSKLNQMNCSLSSFQADLSSAEDINRLCLFLTEISSTVDLHGIIHCACPSINSPMDLHIKVGYEALKSCVENIMPNFISRQDGVIAFISSIATERFQGSSWDSYIMGKTIADKYLHRISSDYKRYGLRCISLMPSTVDTDFINETDLSRENLISPIQVADEFTCMLKKSTQSGILVIESSNTFWREFGCRNNENIKSDSLERNPTGIHNVKKIDYQNRSVSATLPSGRIDEKLFKIFGILFNISPDDLNQEISMVNIPEWDSLNHLSLICEIESEFLIEFTAAEMQDSLSFQSIKKIVLSKI